VIAFCITVICIFAYEGWLAWLDYKKKKQEAGK